jgi:putative molybdopterin biosynthesis protein
MQDNSYLSTEEAAVYLKLKERKLYELATTGQIPCTKVTGRWLFPRVALDRWLAAGLSAPAGIGQAPVPAIVGGSQDPLLEWLVRRSGSGLALLAEGSQAGLDRLVRDEVGIAAIHLHDADDDETANLRAVAAQPGLADAVVIGFARREQALVLAAGNPLGIRDLLDASDRGVRFGLRQKGAGAQLLLDRLLAGIGRSAETITAAEGSYPTGADLALAIAGGEIDCGIASRSVAATHGLHFVPLTWERFDLVLRRRSYFEPPAQALFQHMAKPDFARRAAAFGGYDVSEAGRVRLNR